MTKKKEEDVKERKCGIESKTQRDGEHQRHRVIEGTDRSCKKVEEKRKDKL